MPVISDLPDIPRCHHKKLHEHWFFPFFLPLCDDLQSITCVTPSTTKAIPALFSKATVKYKMFHCFLRGIMTKHAAITSVQTDISPSQHIPCV
jgi:hypothetical protein